MNEINYIHLPSATSTNTMLASIAATAPHATVMSTHCQTAGRGQRGNTWEAEPGMNITLSILLRPQHIEARQQFVISEIVALAVAHTVSLYLPQHHQVAVKWPNDIYVGDRKIAGILIENTITGSLIDRSIAGIGLNINQQHFLSDAPNPVSLFQLTAQSLPLHDVERTLCETIIDYFNRYTPPRMHQELHSLYRSRLWRRSGFHPYRDTADGTVFHAEITDIGPMGHITLRDTDHRLRTYAFKEVTALLR